MNGHRISAFRVGNFKAFGETQRIPLKPITLIFGPNSAGKSSFIHSLALAHEAQFGREKRNLARLDVHHADVGGSSIDLGGFRQYVHRGQANNRVEWGADLRVAELTGRLAQLLAPVHMASITISIGIELDDQDRPKSGAVPRVEAVEIAGDGKALLSMSHRKTDEQGNILRIDRFADDHAIFRQVIKAIIESATTAEEARPEDFDSAAESIKGFLPELVVRIAQFFPSGVDTPKTDDAEFAPQNVLFPVSRGNRKEDISQAIRFYLPRTLNDLVKGISEGLSDELKRLQYLGPLRSFPPRHLAFAEHEDINWYAGGGYAWDVVRRDTAVRDAVNAWLGSDKLKTPYRLIVRLLLASDDIAGPLAEALLSEEGGEQRTKTIEAILEARKTVNTRSEERNARELNKYRDQLQQKLKGCKNQSERDAELSKFFAELIKRQEENKLDDIIHDKMFALAEQEFDLEAEAERIVGWLEISDIDRFHELALIDLRTNSVVTHRDVGIGITQVLPVLVMAYGSNNKILAMEQPEIHLHPALQAELGDIFIESALGERKNTFILETHSEHLILRLQRRIREGKIRPEDIGVIFVEPLSDRGSRVVELSVDEDGDFIDSWPGGFFEESYREKFTGR
jgi:hypothetical protein